MLRKLKINLWSMFLEEKMALALCQMIWIMILRIQIIHIVVGELVISTIRHTKNCSKKQRKVFRCSPNGCRICGIEGKNDKNLTYPQNKVRLL